MLMRGRAEEARKAHNLKVGGSNPSPATSTYLIKLDKEKKMNF